MSHWYVKWKDHFWEISSDMFGNFGVMEHPIPDPSINYLPLTREEFGQEVIDDFIPRAEKILAGGVDMTRDTILMVDPFGHLLDGDDKKKTG